MISCRIGTFETNSSSTHSMVICSPEEYAKWQAGEMVTDRWSSELITKAQAIKQLREIHSEDFDEAGNLKPSSCYEDIDDYLRDWEYRDLDGWSGELEYDINTYKTKSGETLKIVCKYGYDG